MQRHQSGLRLKGLIKPKHVLLQKHITSSYYLAKGKDMIEVMNLKKNNGGKRKMEIKTCYKGKSVFPLEKSDLLKLTHILCRLIHAFTTAFKIFTSLIF